MNKTGLAYLFCFISQFYNSQTAESFVWPIDTPRIIVGNYGELRANHFHAGWDFSTRGKINFPVYAIADGYVSRIKISAVGYGKAVYITHANGKVSVYAHFTNYSWTISNFVKKEQLAKQTYEIELFPAQGEIKVRKGELIGYSGNTGNSSGPHLHFEVRDEKTEVPLNPSAFFGLSDTVRPMLQDLAFYNLADTSNPALISTYKIKSSKRDSLFMQKDSVVLNHSIIGFAFAGFDQFVAKGNPNVIYSAALYLDNTLIYSHALNNIAFDEQRYVNEFAETINKVKYQKCFLPELYPAGMYANCINDGRIVLTDTNYHSLKLMLADESSNARIVQFYFRTKKINGYAKPAVKKGDVLVDCAKGLDAGVNGLRLIVPPKTLYYSSDLTIENKLQALGTLTILPTNLNLRWSVKIGFAVPVKLMAHQNKLVLKNASAVYCPQVKNDSLYYAVTAFGHFQLAQDTLAPKIKTQLSPKKIKRLKKISSFSFVLHDNLSGVGKYNVFVNDAWALAEYDAKSSLLTYYFNDATPAGPLVFRVEAADRVGNRAVFGYKLKR